MIIFSHSSSARVKTLILTSLLLFLVSNCKSTNKPDNQGTACSSPNLYTTITDITPENLAEPSGVVFHPSRNTLYVVGDEGEAAEISLDGNTLDRRRIRQADFEGVTVDPATGLLYIVIEAESLVLEVDPRDLKVEEEYAIDWTFNGSPVVRPENIAIEAIAFAPDSLHVQGGVFYVANKSSVIDDPNKPSAIFEVELPIKDKSAGTTGRVTRNISLQVSSVSGLHYNASSNSLLAVSNLQNAVFTVDLTGEVRSCYQIPGTQQEGIAFDTTGFVYIADDAAGVVHKMR